MHAVVPVSRSEQKRQRDAAAVADEMEFR
jgi:hypothetical protein